MSETSYAFRTFKREFSDLSRLHWYFAYAADRAVSDVRAIGDSVWAREDHIGVLFPATDFDHTRLLLDPYTFIATKDSTLAQLRLVLLIKACALAEDFLHKYVQYWAIWKGYAGNVPNKLSAVGKALVAPALKSNIGSVVQYLEPLFGVSFDGRAGTLVRAYKLRCAAAHNGGVLDHENIKALGLKNREVGQQLTLAWPELHKFLEPIFEVCRMTELVIPEKLLHEIEAFWLVQGMFDSDETMTVNRARDALKKLYGFNSPPSKRIIAKKLERAYT